MKNRRHILPWLSIVVVACFSVLAQGQTTNDKNQFAAVSSSGFSVRFDVAVPHEAVTLTVIGPDNFSFSKAFKGGNAPEFKLIGEKDERLADGQYTYELRVAPNLSAEVRDALKAAREKGNGAEVQRELRKRGALPAELVQSGSFMILNGSAIVGGATEGTAGRAMSQQPAPAPAVSAPAPVSADRVSYK